MEWKSFAAALGLVNEEQLGVLSEIESLVPGDVVAITSSLGRHLASGTVEIVGKTEVTVRLAQRGSALGGGVHQTQVFSRDLYRFHKLSSQESDSVVEDLAVVSGSFIARTDQPQPAPEKDAPPEGAIGDVILATGLDVYHAHVLFSDIRKLGFNRALARHGMASNPTLMAMLVGRSVIDGPGPDAPEWVNR